MAVQTYDERVARLQIANRVRLSNHRTKAELGGMARFEGAARVAEILRDPAGDIGACQIHELLGAIRHVGPTKVTALLKEAGVWAPSRRVRDLTERQRHALADVLITGGLRNA